MKDMEKVSESDRTVYEPPQVKTYTGDDLMEELGPAQAIYGPLPFS